MEGIWEEHGLMINPLPFQGKVGPNLPPGLGDPLSYFYCIFPESFINYLVFQTNFYAHQKQKPFETATSQSMKTFLAINLLMVIKKLYSYKDYWSSNPQLSAEYISSFMPVNRYSWFLAHMRLSDNNFRPNRNDINYDKLYKVRPLINTSSSSEYRYLTGLCTVSYGAARISPERVSNLPT
ncbi:uncharacterized protein LOC112595572 [Melanaphis sacchari]|uniref:uncharacterized protein LOC112595572 n=1 Tax=Melanaphis sacchari TaxID=742174 RepID=UPI000DC135D3|nr:uncharacterized protein LOC112595572 [Melanaphis sacchari]